MSTIPNDIVRYSIDTFSLRGANPDGPDVIWDSSGARGDLELPDTGGTDLAKLGIRIGVDYTFDIVYADTAGRDTLQVLDRAIAALTSCRAAIEDMSGTHMDYGWCLEIRDDEHGTRCTARGPHDVHRYAEPPESSRG